MKIVRRSAWVLAGIAGLPGLLAGLVTLYAFFVLPMVFGFGLAVGRSQIGVGVALGLFFAVCLAFVVGLAYGYGSDEWWFLSTYGTSALLAILATFKVGREARSRLFSARARKTRKSGAVT